VSKNKSTKISYAYDSEADSLISISKAIKGRDYECPECRKRLRKKAGETRREHFFHPKGANCSISYETSLHYGAKLFLKECLTDNKPVEIVFPTEILPENELKSLLAKEEIEKIQIPVYRFLAEPLNTHENERAIDGTIYKADVISRNSQQDIALIWEIFVSHAIEPDKRICLSENGIPYLELKPIEKGFDEFSFEVVSFENLPCLKPETFKLSSLLDVYQEELQGPIAARLLKYFLENIEVLVFDHLVGNLNNARIANNYQLPCHVEDVRKFFQENDSFEIWQTFFKGGKPEEFAYVDLNEVSLVDSKYGATIKFNGKYWANSRLNLCGETLIQFSRKFDGMLSKVDANRRLVSIRTTIFLKDFRKARILIEENDSDCTEMVNLRFLKFDNSNFKDPHYKIEFPEFEEDSEPLKPARLDIPAKLFVKFLEDLKSIASIRLIIGKNPKSGYESVYGLKISGVYSIKSFNLSMRRSVIDSLKQIFFNLPLAKV
jgi:hypothetical protein